MLYNARPVIITALLHALLCFSTYSTTQTGRRTHIGTLTDIHSTLALSPTLSVCSQTASQMSERERQRGRPRVGGVGRLKVKETERENLKSEECIHAQTMHLHYYMNMCMCVCVFLGL